MVLVSALIVLLAREGRIEIAPVALGPVIVFWGLGGKDSEGVREPVVMSTKQ